MASISIDARNDKHSAQEIAAFVANHKDDLRFVAETAIKEGVGLKQIAEATGSSFESIEATAKSLGYQITGGGGGAGTDSSNKSGTSVVNGGGSVGAVASGSSIGTSSSSASSRRNLPPKAIAVPPLAAATVSAVVHGAGNSQIKDEDIRAWAKAEPRTPEQMLEAMVAYNVSAAQLGNALGLSPKQVDDIVKEYGLDKETLEFREVENHIDIQPEKAEAIFEAVHGGGNDSITDDDIKAWFEAAPRSPREALDAMVKYGVSINQAGRAMGLSAEAIQGLVKEYGLGLNRLAVTMTEGWTEEDFQKYLKNHPEKANEIKDSNGLLGKAITSTNTLIDEARQADDVASADKAAYDALNAKFAPAFATYNGYAQEIASLEAIIQGENGQKNQAQYSLDHLDQIDEKRDQRATAERDAKYQIENSNKNIADAQNRINDLRGQMAEMEVWGIPLMQETEAAKAKWDQSAQIATQKNEIAGAQGGLAQQAIDQNKADVNAVVFSGQALNLWIAEHPSLEGADQVHDVLKNTVPVLEQTMTEQRVWTDAARQRGLNLEIDALDLESNTTNVKVELDKVQPARLQAEANIAGKQTIYNDAVAAENKAQADLDAAYEQRNKANSGVGKGERIRLRDEADRTIAHYQEVLASATQNRANAETELNQAKAEGAPAIEAGVQAESNWKSTLATSGNARAQSLSELAVGKQIFGAESNTTNALASIYGLMIDTSKIEVTAAKGLAGVGAIGLDELNSIEDKVQDDLMFSVEGLTAMQKTAANDRAEADVERLKLVPLQAKAYGSQLIADDKLTDANYLQDIYSSTVDLAALQASVTAAEERLNKAKLGLDYADMHMDWAEARTNPKGQAKSIKKAQPGLDAAKQELTDAQQAYDAAVAALNSGKYLDAPLRNLAIESSWAATSAYIDADVASSQALTQGGWTDIAQNRWFNVDSIVAGAQALIVQDATALSELQGEMAQQVTDPTTAQLLTSQSEWNAQWANDFRDLSTSTRSAEYQTYNDQVTLDELTIQADGMQTFGAYLKDKTTQLSETYKAAKSLLTTLDATFQASSQQAQADADSAEAGRNGMTDAELQSMVDFILSRNKNGTVAKNGNPSVDPALTVESFNNQAIETLTNNAFNQHAYELLMVEATNSGVEQPEFTDEQIQQKVTQLRAQENNGVDTTFTDEEIHRTSMQLFVDKAQSTAMDKRKTLAKQLHYADDRQIWIDADPVVQAQRSAALRLAQTAENSTQTAINDGEKLQAGTFVAMLQGQRLNDSATGWADVTATAAQLTSQAAKQADVLVEDFSIEKTAQDNMLAGMTNYLNGNMELAQYMHGYAEVAEDPAVARLMGNQVSGLEKITQTHVPLLETTERLARSAADSVVAAMETAEKLETAADDLKKIADDVAVQVDDIKNEVETDRMSLEATYQKTGEALGKVYGSHEWAVAATREHAEKAKDAKELHEDRVTADEVLKKQKKKALMKLIISGAVALAVTIATWGAGAKYAPVIMGPAIAESVMGVAITMGVSGAVGSALSQLINKGLGLTDGKFSWTDVLVSGLSSAVFFGGLSALKTGASILPSFTAAAAGEAVATGEAVVKAGAEAAGKVANGGLLSKIPGYAVAVQGEVLSPLQKIGNFLIETGAGMGLDIATQGLLNATGLRKGKLDWLQAISTGVAIGGYGLMGPTSEAYSKVINNKELSWLERLTNPEVLKQAATETLYSDISSSLVLAMGGKPVDGLFNAAGGIGNFTGNFGDVYDKFLLKEHQKGVNPTDDPDAAGIA